MSKQKDKTIANQAKLIKELWSKYHSVRKKLATDYPDIYNKIIKD
jgi:hypothetical protein|tara:strand:+ start:171 stop:305 length:135 start_codon:yes stop_codon:yes gene_type:complete